MNIAFLEDMRDALSFPAYVYTGTMDGYTCDRITIHPDTQAFNRKRYIITGKQLCNCMGAAKGFNCKHLSILNEKDSWVKTGVPMAIAIEETNRMADYCRKLFPESAQNWNDKVLDAPEDHDHLTIKTITLNIVENSADFALIASHLTINGIGDLGVIIRTQFAP